MNCPFLKIRQLQFLNSLPTQTNGVHQTYYLPCKHVHWASVMTCHELCTDMPTKTKDRKWHIM